ncbi:MAG: hypothetical protein KGL38_04220 [Gemmatimonadota bacterium]|nr:hypothetical protein [Gemmatimonadota bacterium]
MNRLLTAALAAAVLAALPQHARAQGMGETSRKIAGGGIHAAGWMGRVDAQEARRGSSVNDAKFDQEGSAYHVTTGPATTYWNPANTASGDYTVSATFTEPKYMNLNDHPHPYGVFIGGNDLGTDNGTLLYCEAYGNGTFIVRGFGPRPFQLNGREGEANAAVHKAAGPGQPVTQDIAMRVQGGKVSCVINGTVVATYDRTQVVGQGKLKSLDGVYGVRFAHNTEGIVTGLKVAKP